jgi:hypothetical protein
MKAVGLATTGTGFSTGTNVATGSAFFMTAGAGAAVLGTTGAAGAGATVTGFFAATGAGGTGDATDSALAEAGAETGVTGAETGVGFAVTGTTALGTTAGFTSTAFATAGAGGETGAAGVAADAAGFADFPSFLTLSAMRLQSHLIAAMHNIEGRARRQGLLCAAALTKVNEKSQFPGVPIANLCGGNFRQAFWFRNRVI